VLAVDVEAHVALGSLSKNLLVDAGSIRPVVEVVAGGGPLQRMERQLDSTARRRSRNRDRRARLQGAGGRARDCV
jgi:hypothetical protein